MIENGKVACNATVTLPISSEKNKKTKPLDYQTNCHCVTFKSINMNGRLNKQNLNGICGWRAANTMIYSK